MLKLHGIIHVCNEPELRTVGEHTVISFRAASNGRTRKDDSSFFSCEAWNHLADVLSKYAQVGTGLLIDGHIRQRTSEKDGVKRVYNDVVIDDFQFIGGRKNTEATDEAAA